jgi:hypothetical protein
VRVLRPRGPDVREAKTYIALTILAVAAAFFALYVWLNMGDPEVEIPVAGGDPISGVIVSRDDSSVTILTPVGEEAKYTFARILSSKVEDLRKERPYLSEKAAAALVGSRWIKAEMPESKALFLFVLAVLAALAAIAFSFIAGQDKVVTEF